MGPSPLSVLAVSAVLNSVEFDVNVDWFGMTIHQPSNGAASFLDSATVELYPSVVLLMKLHLVCQSVGLSALLQMSSFHYFLCLVIFCERL